MNWFSAGMAIFSSYLGYEGGKDQEQYGREQEKLAERDALLGKRELQETVRRKEKEDARLRSSALARSAASGATVESGTIATYLDHMATEQGRELDWLKTSGASQIRLRLEGAKLRAKSIQRQGRNQQWGSLMKGFAAGFGYADDQGYFTKGYDQPGFETR